MSSELSRVETYNRNRKKNQTKKPPATEERHRAKNTEARPERKKPAKAPASLSRVKASRKRSGGAAAMPRAASTATGGSRMSDPKQQSYRSRAEKHKPGAARSEEDTESAPARSETYGSRKNVISKYFTNSLFILFLVLTAFLVYWGVKGAPPLEELW